MKVVKTETKFVGCIKNENYPASLEFGKIYRVVPDEKARTHKMIRVVDESGEAYLYSAKSFVHIELPQLAEDAFMALAAVVFAVKIACRRLPAPLSLEFVTVKVAAAF